MILELLMENLISLHEESRRHLGEQVLSISDTGLSGEAHGCM